MGLSLAGWPPGFLTGSMAAALCSRVLHASLHLAGILQ